MTGGHEELKCTIIGLPTNLMPSVMQLDIIDSFK